HHAGLAPEGNREHSIGHQVSALNVGFMEHLQRNREHSIGNQLSALNVGFMERLPYACVSDTPQYRIFTRLRGLLRKTKSTGSNTATLISSFDQRGQAIDGFSKVDGLGVEVHYFDYGVGSHHGRRAPERNREHSIGDQVSALNVGFMERLRKRLPVAMLPVRELGP
ncbi:hypothetical protein ACIPZC_14225, partial [Pseudomonas sp. NPDC089743]|uniref:hypothetical protein n=1 Tax=Pseudomonas sp. NPDC089743 TaxID=3364471 RepID=UPI003822A82F